MFVNDWMKYIMGNENPDGPVIRESLANAEGYPIYGSEELVCEKAVFDGTS